ncbi:MAG: hypothetical protein FWB88_08995 [Defluviitaleaceae bacterium]|nr:hypothetical protein [Defluviitaleaceae bacterium]MCL2239543.1 hypothetical protein [Defluviitaleaceae bacterium]
MLRKQLKYDFIFAARFFLGMGAAGIGLGLLVFIMGGLSQSPANFSLGAMQLMSTAWTVALAMSVAQIYQLYSRQFFGEVGHLMLTLPVGRGVQLLSKYLVALFWSFYIFATMFLSLRLMAARSESSSVGITGPGGEVLTGINLAGPLMQFAALAFSAVAILFLIVTLANCTLGGWRVHTIIAWLVGGLYFAAFVWAIAAISGRAREWVTVDTSFVHDGVVHMGMRTFLAPTIGADIGRVPLGDMYVDVYLIAAALAFGLAAAGATHWLLRKKITLA